MIYVQYAIGGVVTFLLAASILSMIFVFCTIVSFALTLCINSIFKISIGLKVVFLLAAVLFASTAIYSVHIYNNRTYYFKVSEPKNHAAPYSYHDENDNIKDQDIDRDQCYGTIVCD